MAIPTAGSIIGNMPAQTEVLYGIRAEDIAARCGVDISTARRWKRGTTTAPMTALFTLSSDLGCFDSEWQGWILRDGSLHSPEGLAATPGDVRAIPFKDILRASLETRIRELEQEKGPVCEDQPQVDEWAPILDEVNRALAEAG